MGTDTRPSGGSRRWQDVRARAIDATFDADRRRVGERFAVVFRWLFLIVLAILNNVNPHTGVDATIGKVFLFLVVALGDRLHDARART